MHLKTIKIINSKNSKTYPFLSELFQKGFQINLSPITIIVGENGVGKSTFLESLAHKLGFPISGGKSQHQQFYNDLSFVMNFHKLEKFRNLTLDEAIDQRSNYLSSDNFELSANMQLVWSTQTKKGAFVRSETFATMINLPMFSNAARMSHGEGIIDVIQNISDDGIYILDEPEAGLSPLKIIELMTIIQEKVIEFDSQFIISTHSPILMLLQNSTLINMTESQITTKSACETSHFLLTKQILNNHEEFIKKHLQ